MNDASSKQPGNTWRRLHRSLPAAFVALLLCLFCCGMPSASAAVAAHVQISLNSNLPAVSASGTSVVVSGTLTNTGSSEISKPEVRIAVSGELLDTQTKAKAWRDGTLKNVQLVPVASGALDAIAPGSATAFTVAIPGGKLNYTYNLASLPMQITVTDGGSAVLGSARGSIHLQNAAVNSPLGVSVVIPLTVPADPDLFGPSGATRAAAWERAVGPGSAAQRTIDAFAGQPVIFAVDPTLLDPPAAADDNVPALPPPSPTNTGTPSSEGGSTSSDSSGTGSTTQSTGTSTPGDTTTDTKTDTTTNSTTDGASGSTQTQSESVTSSPSSTPTVEPTTPAGREKAAVDSLKDHLSSLSGGQSIWWLPADDPDLTALASQGKAGAALITRDLSRPLPESLQQLSTTRAIWPTGDLAGATVSAENAKLAAAGEGTSVAILPARAIAPTETASATHRTLLTYDEGLSRTFSAATTSPGVQSGELLTALLALYQQSPGTPRSIALVAPRTGGADPTELAAQITALRAAHWVSLQTAAQTGTALRTAPATPLLRTPRRGAAGTPYPAASAPGIGAEQLEDLATSRERLAALQSVMVGGDQVLPQRVQALDLIGSTRWRGAPAKLEAVADRDDAAVASMLGKLTVRSSTINFFADSGNIGVTVSNELNRPVRRVALRLLPRKYQVKVMDAVQDVNVDANARSVAHFHIKAVGAGTVSVDAVLSTPDGASLSTGDSPPQLEINVHPTSGWIMWVLGALAALILLIGLWRAARRGPRTTSVPTQNDSPTPKKAIIDAGRREARPTDDQGNSEGNRGTDADG